jgi:ferredoxin
MHKVTLEGLDTVVEARDGRRLVLAIEDAGIDILHRCGGNARCATCRVEIVAGEPSPITAAEALRLEKVVGRTEESRLSCQVQVRNDLTVRILRRLSENPELGDSGPRPIEWPAGHPLPPEE